MFKQYILVAGVNYENLRNPFNSLCQNRMKSIIEYAVKTKMTVQLRFFIFDFQAGTVETIDVTIVKGKASKKNKVDNLFNPVTSASYDSVNGSMHFKPGQTSIMSILDIYAKIQEIGRSPEAGTLMQLNFMSHAFHDGPVLVNSFDNSPTLKRDPDDKDPRGHKDFITSADPRTSNMRPLQLKNLQDAFHPTGFSWIWGCMYTTAFRSTINKIMATGKYISNGLLNSLKYKITYHPDELKDICRMVYTNSKTIEVTGKEVKEFICSGIMASYAFILAQKTNRKVFAALVGTSANYEEDRKAFGLVHNPVMRIPKGYYKIQRFYKKYFSFELDPAGKGYGVYTPGMSCTPGSSSLISC